MKADAVATLCETVFSDLGYAVILQDGAGRFVLPSGSPGWLRAICQAVDTPTTDDVVIALPPFLAHYAEEAEPVWQHPADGQSETAEWTEGLGRHTYVFSVAAHKKDDQCFLVVRKMPPDCQDQRFSLQRARELMLEHRHNVKQAEKQAVFAHMIVHDLLQPVNGMASVFELLSLELPGTERHHLLEEGKRQVKRVSRLARSILEIYTREKEMHLFAGVPTQEVNLPLVVERAVRDAALAAQTRGVRLTCDVPRAAKVAIDQAKLERVLQNLLDNALKHAPTHSTVAVVVSRRDDMWQVEVRDAGPGVPPARQPQLFAKFTEKTSGGRFHFGLYFCQLTIRERGGEIGYLDREGGGSIFWFRLHARDEA